jgi:hypothetical protein
MAKATKLEDLADRVRELERVLIGKSDIRATTRQGRAISFLVENLETLQEIIAEHKRLSS